MYKRKVVLGVISAVVFLAMLGMILNGAQALGEVAEYLRQTRLVILVLLIPNIILMFYAAGRIWYPYLRNYGLSARELGEIQYELHFVNTVIPAASLSGLMYATERLKPYGVTAGYAGGMYIYRYIVSIVTNWIGIIVSVFALLLMGALHEMPVAPLIFVAGAIGVMVTLLLAVLLMITGKIRVKNTKVSAYLRELRQALTLAGQDKSAMVESWLWGMLYTILEDTPFLVVAWSMGHPELFLQMVVAGAVGVIVGSLIPTPGGIGGFEGAMIYLLGGFGSNIALASVIVVATRAVILVGTLATSYPFWQRGMLKIGKST